MAGDDRCRSTTTDTPHQSWSDVMLSAVARVGTAPNRFARTEPLPGRVVIG
jgi:hypothetical protein